jgi:hypothetical protein
VRVGEVSSNRLVRLREIIRVAATQSSKLNFRRNRGCSAVSSVKPLGAFLCEPGFDNEVTLRFTKEPDGEVPEEQNANRAQNPFPAAIIDLITTSTSDRIIFLGSQA